MNRAQRGHRRGLGMIANHGDEARLLNKLTVTELAKLSKLCTELLAISRAV